MGTSSADILLELSRYGLEVCVPAAMDEKPLKKRTTRHNPITDSRRRFLCLLAKQPQRGVTGHVDNASLRPPCPRGLPLRLRKALIALHRSI